MPSFLTGSFKEKIVAAALVAATAVGVTATPSDAFAQNAATPQNTTTSAMNKASTSQLSPRQEYELAQKPLHDAARYSEKAAGVGIVISTSPAQEKVWSAVDIGEAVKAGLARRGISNSQPFVLRAGEPNGSDRVYFLVNGDIVEDPTINQLKDGQAFMKVVLAQSNAEAVHRAKIQNRQEHHNE